MRLIDRDDESRALRQLCTDAATGTGGVALLRGAAGTGKTALLNGFAEAARTAGAMVGTACGSAAERTVPLGVVTQLLHALRHGAEAPRPLTELLDEITSATRARGPAPPDPHIAHRICAELLQLATERPVAICVDDAQHADIASLRALLHLVRRLRDSRVAVLFAERTGTHDARSMLHTELPHESGCLHLSTGVLSEHATGRLVTSLLNERPPAELARRAHRISGGNPMLTTALVADTVRELSRQPHAAAGHPMPASEFRRAFHGCLYSLGPPAVRLARALAVLDGSADHALLARLVETNPHTVRERVDALNDAGLLTGLRFRHPAARESVLDELPGQDRGALHSDAARILFDAGAPTRVVADHLVAGGRVDERWADECWAATTLLDAAEQAVLDDRFDDAAGYLRLAEQANADNYDQARFVSVMSTTEWHLNPTAAVRRLPQLSTAINNGRLDDGNAVAVFENLLWQGNTAEAETVLERLCRHVDGRDVRLRSRLTDARHLVSGVFPAVYERTRRLWPAGCPELDEAVVPANDVHGAFAVIRLALRDGNERAVPAAERLLENMRAPDRNLSKVVVAVTALVLADRLDRAELRTGALLDASSSRDAPLWCGLLGALRAEIALRKGAVEQADLYARRAISELPAEVWGVGIAAPLSTAVLANTRMNRPAEAAALLDQPVPKALFESVFGLRYLLAGGEHHLVTGRYAAAMTDFTTCGELACRWKLDRPELFPWRSGVARALLRRGDERQARHLLEEQLGLLGTRPSGALGNSLRLLATTAEPSRRPALLRKSVAVLRQVNDRRELATVLADLACAYQELGEHRMATAASQQAAELYRQRRHERAQPDVPAARENLGESTALRASPSTAGTATLTDAERRVSTLAAQGHSNREIALRLSITVSTVEQHLTRVYRKLKIKRRKELPVDLRADISHAG